MVVYTYQHLGKLKQESFHFEVNLGYIARHMSKREDRGCSSVAGHLGSMYLALDSMVSRKRKERKGHH